jgi:cellulose synthase (UDP-forming)
MYDRIVIRGEAEILDEAEAEAHLEAEANGQVAGEEPAAVPETVQVIAQAPPEAIQVVEVPVVEIPVVEIPVAEAAAQPVVSAAPEPKFRRPAPIPMARVQAEPEPATEAATESVTEAFPEAYEMPAFDLARPEELAAAEPEIPTVDEGGPAAD